MEMAAHEAMSDIGNQERNEERTRVRDAQNGDLAAFEQLYRENVGRVYAVCLRMTAETQLAEELTQETFVRAWEKLASFRGESRFSSWIHRVAVNVALAGIRTDKRRDARIAPATHEETHRHPSPASPPGAAADLERAIAALPHGAREIFVLHDVEGYKHDEIARLTGRSSGTCKAQLHRARRLLREALSK